MRRVVVCFLTVVFCGICGFAQDQDLQAKQASIDSGLPTWQAYWRAGRYNIPSYLLGSLVQKPDDFSGLANGVGFRNQLTPSFSVGARVSMLTASAFGPWAEKSTEHELAENGVSSSQIMGQTKLHAFPLMATARRDFMRGKKIGWYVEASAGMMLVKTRFSGNITGTVLSEDGQQFFSTQVLQHTSDWHPAFSFEAGFRFRFPHSKRIFGAGGAAFDAGQELPVGETGFALSHSIK